MPRSNPGLVCFTPFRRNGPNVASDCTRLSRRGDTRLPAGYTRSQPGAGPPLGSAPGSRLMTAIPCEGYATVEGSASLQREVESPRLGLCFSSAPSTQDLRAPPGARRPWLTLSRPDGLCTAGCLAGRRQGEVWPPGGRGRLMGGQEECRERPAILHCCAVQGVTLGFSRSMGSMRTHGRRGTSIMPPARPAEVRSAKVEVTATAAAPSIVREDRPHGDDRPPSAPPAGRRDGF